MPSTCMSSEHLGVVVCAQADLISECAHSGHEGMTGVWTEAKTSVSWGSAVRFKVTGSV